MIKPIEISVITKSVIQDTVTRSIKINITNPNNATVRYVLEYKVYSLEASLVRGSSPIISNSSVGSLSPNATRTIVCDVRKYFDIPYFIVGVQHTTYLENTLNISTVAELCENSSEYRFNATSTLPKTADVMYLKAFCNIPGEGFDKAYATWEKSVDGIIWEPYYPTHAESLEAVDFSDVDTLATANSNLDSESDTTVYKHFVGYEMRANSPLDTLTSRADVIKISATERYIDNTLYKFTLRHLREIDDDDSTDLEVTIPGTTTKVSLTSKHILGSVVYTPMLSTQPEFLVEDISNVSKSKALYSGGVLYNFGNPDFKNALIASYPGEIVRPLSRATFLNSLGDAHVTCIAPWKEYLVAFTNISAHLISPVSEGYISNTINSFIGVPDADYRCTAATLNGIIFKSGLKVYMLYPNVYAGDNSILNLTDISEPIDSILEEHATECVRSPFAFSTDSEYTLLLPHEESTACLRYNFSDKLWTFHTYPVQMYDYKMLSSTNIRVFGRYFYNGVEYTCEYLFDAERTLEDAYGENILHADYVRPNTGPDILAGYQGYIDSKCVLPIPFEYDSGQKADSINITKQYVESKLNFATLHPKDAFPIRLTVHIDGTSHPTVQDVSTDSAFWKRDTSDLNVLGKPLMLNSSDIFNTFRQMFVRYSGKGRSIRHIIEGESLYAFKMYDILCRYRNLNVKQ